jgi:segregation and condensation protein A
MTEAYRAKTGTFEGPMELLLSLIEKRKLFINEVSLAGVTDEYLAFLKEATTISIGSIANFIVIASTLLLVKSRSLLPDFTLTGEEEESIGDLENRLRLYKIVRDIIPNLKSLFSGNMIFGRPFSRNKEVVFLPDEAMTKENLKGAILNLIEGLPKKTIVPEVAVKKVITIEEMINRLTDRITSGMSMSFKKISTGEGGKEARVHMIVSFLALLELVKQGIFEVKQAAHFEDIIIEKNDNGTGLPVNA